MDQRNKTVPKYIYIYIILNNFTYSTSTVHTRIFFNFSIKSG